MKRVGKSNQLSRVAAGFMIGAGSILFLLALFAGVLIARGSFREQNQESPYVNGTAPVFELYNVNGESVRISDYRGKTVLINFWATWCPPCIVEMPAIEQVFQEYQGELVVLAVNISEPKDTVRQFVDEYDLTFEVLLDPGGMIERLYRVRGYPTTFIIDETGKVEVRHEGYMTEARLYSYLEDVGVRK